ncbi:MAG: hypothetical protein WC371_03685 [Parachlamydiales bacterium]|jgi:hypothetical protein
MSLTSSEIQSLISASDQMIKEQEARIAEQEQQEIHLSKQAMVKSVLSAFESLAVFFALLVFAPPLNGFLGTAFLTAKIMTGLGACVFFLDAALHKV